MKIALVRRGHSSTGGAEAYLLRFAAEAARLGHDPILVTTVDWPAERWPHPHAIRLSARAPGAFAEAVAALTDRFDVTLSLERVPGCDVFRAGDGVHAAWMKRRTAFEPVWKQAFRWFNKKHKQILRLEQGVFNPETTGAIIANSRMVRDEIRAHFDFPEDRVHVVYNGITPLRISADRAAARRHFLVPENHFAVLFLGSGWERKGLRTAVEATVMCENTTLLVAGRGTADVYDKGSNVEFLGPVRDLGRLFAAADLFVLPTWYDPFSNACLEALAAGLPVITTTANGFSEIIEPGVHGDIVEPGDSLEIAERIDFWRSENRAAKAADACRERAKQFSIERNVRETLAILEQSRLVKA